MPSNRSKRRDLYVVRTQEGWTIRSAGSNRSAGIYETQADATRAAQAKLREKGGELKVQGRDGRWRESFTIGRGSMEKLNAVEGIHLSPEMRGALRELDRRGLSASQRREKVAARFIRKG
jgi:hypothetical protein